MDMLLYAVVGYIIALEKIVEDQNADPSADPAIDVDEWPLEDMVENETKQQKFHRMHIVLIAFLLFKEALIYCFCVRRAYNKLAKEKKYDKEKMMGIVDDQYLGDQHDRFKRIN